MTITSNEGLLILLATAAVSAVLASGLTAAALILFFRNLLSSPLALKLAEGLVDSFPPQTRELIHVMAQFFEVVSQDPPPEPAKES